MLMTARVSSECEQYADVIDSEIKTVEAMIRVFNGKPWEVRTNAESA
jgi:predicted fused transcriptional regulator/phosphomethylpyrimidine kinase